MNKCVERLYNGLIKENPTFVLTLGMCPTLAVTTSAINGIGMGLSSTVVLVMSNLMISLLRKVIPDGVRMPAFIVIVASFVTMVQFLMQGYLPSLYDSLGIYIPLIVVNCIILGRAEAYASKNPVLPSAFDGLGMGLGFTCAITILGAVRELIGAGTILSTGSSALVTIPESVYTPASIFILAPGAFFVLAMCIAIMNKIKAKHGMEPAQVPDYCSKDGSCDSCANTMCGGKAFAEEKKQRTDQLLYTSPIRSGSIVFGKYLASVTLLAISMLVSIIEAGVLSMFGNVNWKTVLTGCLGYFLLGACLMAVGMFVSSLTDNQMIAAALSFAVVLFCMLLPNISNVVPGRARYTYIVCVLAVILIAWFFYDETKNVKITAGVGVAGIAIIAILSKVKPALFDNGLSKIIDWFSVLDRFNDFCSGILNASSIIYYVSFIAVFLFLTMQGIEKRRWN